MHEKCLMNGIFLAPMGKTIFFLLDCEPTKFKSRDLNRISPTRRKEKDYLSALNCIEYCSERPYAHVVITATYAQFMIKYLLSH